MSDTDSLREAIRKLGLEHDFQLEQVQNLAELSGAMKVASEIFVRLMTERAGGSFRGGFPECVEPDLLRAFMEHGSMQHAENANYVLEKHYQRMYAMLIFSMMAGGLFAATASSDAVRYVNAGRSVAKSAIRSTDTSAKPESGASNPGSDGSSAPHGGTPPEE